MNLLALLLAVIFSIEIYYIDAINTSTPAYTVLLFNSTTKSAKTKTFPENTNSKTLHRLAGGHIHHATYKRDEEKFPQSTRGSKVYFRRKQSPKTLTQNNAEAKHIKANSKYEKENSKNTENQVDSNKLNNWDNGLLLASAGDGQELTGGKTDESKKTLADQVAEGKYGLIQTEIFKVQPKRPGIISYLPNPEVPKDTNENYGGLDEDDIWLAEDHLLVLKGGSFAKNHSASEWKPIDDYEAPKRPIKIPDNPKIPPPFLVQLEENGPIQFIGNNQIPLINPFTNESILLFPEGGFPKTETVDTNTKNLPAGPRPYENITNGFGYQYPPPVPPWSNNQTFTNPFLNVLRPPFPFPFHPSMMGGSLDSSNITDLIDEDDPSLYYPPPYTFVYKSNYTNLVPPGPLVPGIVLPPPPNFFSRLNPTKPMTTRKPITTSFRTVTTKTTVPTSTVNHQKTVKSSKPQTTTFVPKAPSHPKLSPEFVTEPISAVAPPTRTTTTVNSITTLRKVTTETPPLHLISFVPQGNNNGNNDKGNPIYYEYFDARPAQKGQNIGSQTPYTAALSSLTPPRKQPPPKSTSVPRTQLRPQKQPPKRPYNAYLPAKPPYDQDNNVYITPKPEIIPNGVSNNGFSTSRPIITLKPHVYGPFEKEIETIRQTLQYYKTQAIANNIQRIPKAKAVYEYSFNAALDDGQNQKSQKLKFAPPNQYDSQPFKPMVQYSEPLNSENGFTAIPPPSSTSSETPVNYYTTTDSPNGRPISLPVRGRTNGGRYFTPNISSLKYVPYSVPPEKSKDDTYGIYNTNQRNPTDVYYNQKYYNNVPSDPASPAINYNTNYQKPIEQPWITVEKQQFRELPPKEINVQIYPNQQPYQQYSPNDYVPYNNDNIEPINNYYKVPLNVNNVYANPNQQTKLYQKQIDSIRHQLQQKYPAPIIHQDEYSLINDTAVNWKHPRRPINPDSEFIEIGNQRITPQQLPPVIHQPPPPLPPTSQDQYYQRQPVPINNKDILVNYKYPLPTINVDSEYLPQDYLPRYNRRYQNPVVQYKLPGDRQAGVYFITPREVRLEKNRM